MTLPELIDEVLAVIRSQFYGERTREFMRDRTALMRGVARWGHECHQRGWQFDAPFIASELLTLLNEIKRAGAEFRYLPTYLHGAVGRSVGQRAEELSAQAKHERGRVTPAARLVNEVISGVRTVTAVREPSPTEQLARLYADLGRRQRARRDGLKRTKEKLNGALRKKERQGELI